MTTGAVARFKTLPTDEVGVVYTEDDWNPWTAEDMDQLAASKEKK